MDSATTLAVAQAEGFECHALSFSYGQRHRAELAAAAEVARSHDVLDHRVIAIDLRLFGGSALTSDTPVPLDRVEVGADVPATYVPARNTIFLAFALAHAEVTGAQDIFIGVTAVDYSGYPDCRPEFIAAFQAMARLGTRLEGVRIHAPLAELSKGAIIEKGLALGVEYSLTRSCYQLDDAGISCGRCDACQLRLAGFAALGLIDPVPYQVA
jgi:7-cyano-7-deazaguanine synthase